VIRTLNPAWGGPVEGVRSLAIEGEKHGFHTEIVCLDYPDAPWLASWSVPVHSVGSVVGNYGRTVNLDKWLDAQIRRFDAVIINGIWMYFSYATWKAATRHGVPYYLFIHGALDPWFKKNYPHKQIKKTAYWLLCERKVLRDAAATLFTTEDEKLLAHNAFWPYRCKPAVIGLGIARPSQVPDMNVKQAAYRQLASQFPAVAGRCVLLFLARIHEKKGIDLLLKAFALVKQHYRNHVVLIAGPGEQRLVASLQQLASELSMSDQVIWTGPLYDEAKWRAMRAAEVYVLPSHQENFGVSVVEALASGTPVLVSDKVNIWREIDREQAGMAAPDDLSGTVQLLTRWGELSEEEICRMSVRAWACFSRHFDIAPNSRQFFDLLRGHMHFLPTDPAVTEQHSCGA